jgi:hypothetical protein
MMNNHPCVSLVELYYNHRVMEQPLNLLRNVVPLLWMRMGGYKMK